MSELQNLIEETSSESIEELKSELANAIQRGDEQFDRAETLQKKVNRLEEFIDRINKLTEEMKEIEGWEC